MLAWLALGVGAAVPLVSLLLLRSVWWTFGLYHGVVCLLIPLLYSALALRTGARGHLRDIGLLPLRLGVGLGLGILLGAGTFVALGLLRAALLTDQIGLVLARWGVTPAGVPMVLAFMLVGNGAAEELYWRGWLHRRLEGWRRRPAAIVVAAAAYASYHVATIGTFIANPLFVGLLLGVVFGAGVFFGWLRERSGSVWPPLLAHTGATAGYVLAFQVWGP